MAIEKNKQYVLVYVSVSFRNNISFLKKIKKEFGFEIPYLDIPCLSEELREVLDSYLYLEESLVNRSIFSMLFSKYKQITFTDLGFVSGQEVYDLINNCISDVLNSVRIGDYYKIIKHPLKNLIIKVISIEGDSVIGEYTVLEEVKRIKVPISKICSFDNIYQVERESQFTNYVEVSRKMGNRKAIIIDGHNILYRSMFGYDTKYTAKDHIFVGGAFGMYFSFLKLKELFPEYEIHLVFDGYDAEKFNNNPNYKATRRKRLVDMAYPQTDKFKEAFKNNMEWAINFAFNLGFNVYYLKDKEGDDVIGSIARFLENKLDYKHIMIYSTDKDFFTLVTDRVIIYTPRTKFRGISYQVTKAMALEEFEVNKIEKINWVKSIKGDGSDCIGSVNIFNHDNKIKNSRVKKQHYLPIINESNYFDEVKEKLKENKKFKVFIESGQMDCNFKLLTIQTELFNNKVDLSEYTGICNYEKAVNLLVKFSFYKELESFERNYRVLRGVW